MSSSRFGLACARALLADPCHCPGYFLLCTASGRATLIDCYLFATRFDDFRLAGALVDLTRCCKNKNPIPALFDLRSVCYDWLDWFELLIVTFWNETSTLLG